MVVYVSFVNCKNLTLFCCQRQLIVVQLTFARWRLQRKENNMLHAGLELIHILQTFHMHCVEGWMFRFPQRL